MAQFDKARALVARARERAIWIGDDHGDPHEAALLNRSIPVELNLALKEILDHLRSALDYVAHELCEAATGARSAKPIYFPITARGFSAVDFPSRVGKLMPGLLEKRPDLLAVLERFQPYASPENGWLADLATLANHTKHVDLEVNEVSAADVDVMLDEDGNTIIRTHKGDGSPLNLRSLMLVEGEFRPESPDCRFIYVSLAPIQEELLGFLRAAIPGVQRIIDDIELAL